MRDGFIKVAAGTPGIRVADCRYNAEQIFSLMREADQQGVRVLCLPELCLTGCTCGALFFHDTLLDGAMEGLRTILEATRNLEVLTALGMPVRAGGKLDKKVLSSLILILVSVFLWFMAYNGVTTAFSRYAVTVWKMEGGGFASCLMVATVAAIISYIPIGAIASRIGRKKTILMGLTMMLISFSAVFFYPTYNVTANFFFALIGFGWAAVGVNSLPMVVEMSRGSEIGKYTGLYYTFSMTAQIFTPVVSGLLLQYISYNTLFPYAIFFTCCAILTMSQVRHGDSKPIPKKKALENFDVDD